MNTRPLPIFVASQTKPPIPKPLKEALDRLAALAGLRSVDEVLERAKREEERRRTR